MKDDPTTRGEIASMLGGTGPRRPRLGNLAPMIIGAHIILYSENAEADRAFFRDVLGFKSADAGDGWLIFALPPSELAVHPAEGGRHELYLMCDDLEATTEELRKAGIEVSDEVRVQTWGRMVAIRLPGGGDLYLYEPHHASPLT